MSTKSVAPTVDVDILNAAIRYLDATAERHHSASYSDVLVSRMTLTSERESIEREREPVFTTESEEDRREICNEPSLSRMFDLNAQTQPWDEELLERLEFAVTDSNVDSDEFGWVPLESRDVPQASQLKVQMGRPCLGASGHSVLMDAAVWINGRFGNRYRLCLGYNDKNGWYVAQATLIEFW